MIITQVMVSNDGYNLPALLPLVPVIIFPMSSSLWAIHHLLPYQLDCERDIDNKFDSFVYGYEYMLVYSVGT